MNNEHDLVNHPRHYTKNPIETIDVIKNELGNEFCAFLKGQVIKYTSRSGSKYDAKQDLEKARWYLDRWIKELGE